MGDQTGENGGNRRKRTPKKPTIMDVARVSGVSYATVSRFLNGNPHVSPEAAERIAAAVREVNYIPNNAARSLVRQRTQTVAFVMHGEPETITTDPNINTIMVNANRRLGEAGYQLVVLICDTDEAAERIARLVRSGFADGWILNNLHVGDRLFTVFRESNAPVAVSGVGYGGQSPFPTVDIDNHAASTALTRYMLDQGYRRIAYLRGPNFIPCSYGRFEGFRSTMKGLFDPDLVVDAYGWSRADGREAVRLLLAKLAGIRDDDADGNRPDVAPDADFAGVNPDALDIAQLLRDHGVDAMMCANDCIAAGAMQYLVSHGVRVPQDIAIAGFDDSPDAAASTPPLTTVRQPIGRFGIEMADMVLAQIEGDEPKRIVWLPTEVVPRQST